MGKKFFFEKSRTVPKKWTLWSRPVLYVTRETFLVQFLGPIGTISSESFVKLLVQLFWSVQVVLKNNTDEKP